MAPSLEGRWSNHSFPGESDGASIALSLETSKQPGKCSFIHSSIQGLPSSYPDVVCVGNVGINRSHLLPSRLPLELKKHRNR